jgi:hypothetical protein
MSAARVTVKIATPSLKAGGPKKGQADKKRPQEGPFFPNTFSQHITHRSSVPSHRQLNTVIVMRHADVATSPFTSIVFVTSYVVLS